VLTTSSAWAAIRRWGEKRKKCPRAVMDVMKKKMLQHLKKERANNLRKSFTTPRKI
jgi:hypothetical protein